MFIAFFIGGIVGASLQDATSPSIYDPAVRDYIRRQWEAERRGWERERRQRKAEEETFLLWFALGSLGAVVLRPIALRWRARQIASGMERGSIGRRWALWLVAMIL